MQSLPKPKIQLDIWQKPPMATAFPEKCPKRETVLLVSGSVYLMYNKLINELGTKRVETSDGTATMNQIYGY